MRQRLLYMDFAAGILIVWLVFYHVLNWYWHTDLMLHFPYLFFFLQWFFYRSGYLFELKNQKKEWSRGVRKLLIPFIVWALLGYILEAIFISICGGASFRKLIYSPVRSLLMSGVPPMSGACWFLFGLFCVRQISNFLYAKYSPWVIGIVGFLFACILHWVNSPYIPDWMAYISTGLTFFTMGYLMKEWEDNKWVVGICAVVYVIFCYIGFPIVRMAGNNLYSGNYLLWFPVSLSGIVVFNYICKTLFYYSESAFPILRYLGRNSLDYMMVHQVVLWTVIWILSLWVTSDESVQIYWVLGAMVTIVPIICMIINYIRKRYGKEV